MGASKKITVSYWYKLIALLGLCKGPFDALLEIRGGDRVAWKGRKAESGDINVSAADLYGGESAEGGIEGIFELRMGEAGQAVSDYMVTHFGAAQSAYRGRAAILLKGPKIGAGNPYPKPLGFKLERIYKGWDNDDCWYPEKAGIPIPASDYTTVLSYNTMIDANIASLDGLAGGIDFDLPAGGILTIKLVAGAWSYTPSDDYQPENYHYLVWTNRFGILNVTTGAVVGVYWNDTYTTFGEAEADHAGEQVDVTISTAGTYRIFPYDAEIDDNRGRLDFRVEFAGPGSFAMNPAHILYDSITSRRENGGMEEPVGRINEASFIAAADRFYDEGLGLCCTWYGGESAEQFQQRIINVAGASLSQSRQDGQYYIDLLRAVEDPDSLPTITDAEIAEWEAEPAIPSESINQIQVKWFDPTKREERITTPVQALGAIQDAGGLFGDQRAYYEIPYEALALRIAQRDLNSVASVLWKFTISCTRKSYALRKGQQVRLLAPNRGFADVIVVIGDIDYGNLTDDTIKLVLLQDVFSLPDASFVDPQTSLDEPPDAEPEAIEEWVLQESPYAVLAGLTPEELETIDEDSGLVGALVRKPANGRDFTYASKAAGEDYEEYGNFSYTPSLRIVEGDDTEYGTLREEFTFEDGQYLDDVGVGRMVVWGFEICKVKAIDILAGTITLGRGCGDTVPQPHDPDSLAFLPLDTYATDGREYVDGETVYAKVMNRTGQAKTPIIAAPEKSVVLAHRQTRPYPPANIKINGVPIFDIGTGSGGGGGGGGGGAPGLPPATGSNGSPASTEVGPEGGFPDNGPPIYPLPTAFGANVIDDPTFDDPDTLSRWRKKDGSPLGSEWSLVGGKLQLQASIGTYEAYDFGTRFSKPYMPFPRLTIDVAADVQNTPGCMSSVGAAWGTWNVGNMPTYPEVSAPALYVDETNVPHSWTQVILNAGGGVGLVGEYSVVNFVPMVRHTIASELATATVDNFTLEITEVDPPCTAEPITNLDLSAGLTGITLWPDPADTNPYVPDISVVGGVAIADFHSAFGLYRWLIWDTPLTLVDIDHFVRFRMKGWSNDATLLRNVSGKWYPFGGVTAGLVVKSPAGDVGGVSAAGRVERGDFTQREYYHHFSTALATALAAGYTVHAGALMVGSVGTQAKFKDFEVATTDDPYP